MKSPIILLIALAFLAAEPAFAAADEGPQPSTKERIKADAKQAGHAIKKGAIETGHAVRKGAKEAWSATKSAIHNATDSGGKDEGHH